MAARFRASESFLVVSSSAHFIPALIYTRLSCGHLAKADIDTRWDAHSGEPTTSSSGKMGTFSQGNPYYSPDDENTPPNNLRYADQLQKHGNLATRATYFASKGLKKTIKPKALEPWSRATGRTNFVDPVQDTPQEQKLSVPPKNPRRPSPAISPVESPSDGETLSVSLLRERALMPL